MNIRKITAAVFVLTSLFGAFMIFQYRDIVFNWDFAAPAGTYKIEDDRGLSAKANEFMEARFPGKTCVNQWLGADERYIYALMFCGTFVPKDDGRIQLDQGFSITTRIEYESGAPSPDGSTDVRFLKFDQPEDGGESFASYKRLFPKLVYALDRAFKKTDQAKLMAEGLRRQQSKPATP